MLLWEALCTRVKQEVSQATDDGLAPPRRAARLPFERQCVSVTKSGKRCRGKIMPNGTEFCLFHDPAIAEKRRQRIAAKGHRRNRLAHLPDGYLRKLTSRAAVGQAMDRLYREVRLGDVTPEMGNVLFTVITRMLDSGLCDGGVIPRRPSRSKAERVRPKLAELLTNAERAAWRKAVANAPPRLLYQPTEPTSTPIAPAGAPSREVPPEPARVALRVS